MSRDEVVVRTAIRVLTAITDHQKPDPEDTAALRAFAPECAEYALDDLAREIVEHIVNNSGSVFPLG